MRTATTLFTLSLVACTPPGADDTGAESSTSGESSSSSSTGDTPPTTSLPLECLPGQERCADASTREVCRPTGLGWEPVACGQHQSCTEDGNTGATACLGPCETLTETSLGCEFLAIRMRSENSSDDPADADAIVVGNTDPEKSANVSLFLLPNYFNEPEQQGDTITLAPGESHVFTLTNEVLKNTSNFRSGGVYRVVSDYPISAYQHSPLANSDSNDASLLLPVKALGTEHVIPSYPAHADPDQPNTNNGRPSYFVVVATENDTQLEWTPRTRTYGPGKPFESVEKGGPMTKPLTLQRFDTVMVGASSPDDDLDFAAQDVSGTVVRADKPIAVMGATSCARVPFASAGGCNHLQEQVIPTKYWGERYVAAHSPVRGEESHYWRVYGTVANQQIVMDPKVGTATGKIDELGAYMEFVIPAGLSTTFESNAPFMPVQYLAGGKETGVDFGDPAMLQAIPVAQHQSRYVFVTGADYEENFVQVTRAFDGPDVLLDGVAVDGWYLINTTGTRVEVADVPLGPSSAPAVHSVESAAPFGINVFGYVKHSAYAYPGGMALKPINPDGG